MEVYAAFVCGNNPVKTTSTKQVSQGYVEWHVAVDLEVFTADEVITITVIDYDSLGKDDIVGQTQLRVADFFPKMEGDLSDIRQLDLPWKKLLYKGVDAGAIDLTLYATAHGQTLPPVMPGMDLTKHVGQFEPLWPFGTQRR